MNPTKSQFLDAIADLSVSDKASEALENLADEYADLDDMRDARCDEAESLLTWDEDCFSYLQDNDVTDWTDAIDDGRYTLADVARFFLEREIDEAIDSLEAIDYESAYPQEGEDESEGE